MNASQNMNLVGIFTQKTTTLGIHHMILVYGRLTIITGVHVVEEVLLVMQAQILNVLRKCINGEEIHGKIGQHAGVVDVVALLDCIWTN